MQPETPLELPEEIIYVQGTYDDLTSAIARGITRPEKSREQFAAELARESDHTETIRTRRPSNLSGIRIRSKPISNGRTTSPKGMAEEHRKALADLHQAYRRIDAAATTVKVIGGVTVVGVAGDRRRGGI